MKLKKRIASICFAVMMMCTMSISANAEEYSDSSNWYIHWSKYDSNSPQTVRLVYYGNGYNATMTSKGGSCASNYVTISAPGIAGQEITEINKSIKLRPTNNGTDYIDFKIVLNHSGGTEAYNSGTIALA